MKTNIIDYKKYPILVLDDDVNYLASFSGVLEYDFTVYSASGIDEARRILDEENIVILLSDQKMPEMTGVHFLAEIKEKYPDVVRVLITGYSEINAVIDSINKGYVYKYVDKIMSLVDTILLIKQCIDYYFIKQEQKKHELKKLTLSEKIKFLRLFGRELYEELVPALNVLHEYILRQGGDMAAAKQGVADIFNKLLILGEFGNIKVKDSYGKVSVNRVISNIVDFYKGQSGFCDVEIDLDLCDHLLEINIDENRLGCSLQEIFLNAKEAVYGKGKITIKTEYSLEEKCIKIIISDNGCGIKSDEMDKIFVPFYTTKDNKDHLGLGLALAENVLFSYDAKIEIKSDECGTDIYINLPL